MALLMVWCPSLVGGRRIVAWPRVSCCTQRAGKVGNKSAIFTREKQQVFLLVDVFFSSSRQVNDEKLL